MLIPFAILLGTVLPLMAFSQTDPALESLLDRLSGQAARFATEFPAVACTEQVTQLKFAPGPRILHRLETKFDYLILVNADNGDFSVEESRLALGKAAREPSQPLLSTTGFAALLLVFHPRFLSSYRFSLLEPETRDGVAYQRIQFVHTDGEASPSVMEAHNRQYPVAWRGVAWIDPATTQVARLHTELREPMEDVGLRQLTSEVTYAPSALTPRIWLPSSAVIEAHTAHQHWRNTHQFSAFRKFDVNAETLVKGVKPQ